MKSKFLIENSFFQITLSNLIVSILVTILIVVGHFFLMKFINKNKNLAAKTLFQNTLLLTTVLIILYIFSSITIKDFFTHPIFRTKYLHFNFPHIFYVIFIFSIAFFCSKLISILIQKKQNNIQAKLNTKKETIIISKYLIWIVALIFILKITLITPDKLVNFELLKIKNVSISIFDLVFFTIIIAFTGLFLLGLKRYFNYQVETKKIAAGNAAALFKITKYVLWITTIIIGLRSTGFDLSIILAGSAALLVGFGIGIQNIFSDIVSGFILLLERPLRTTDIIEVDGMVGKVINIGIRTTTLYTRDDTVIRVPNSKFTSDKIINWSDLKNNTRFRVNIGVAYGSDVELVMETMKKCATEHKFVAKKPEPFVRFENFGDSSLDFSLFFWSNKNMTIETVKSDIRIAIDKEFRKAKISIPFPQRDLHFINDNNNN